MYHAAFDVEPAPRLHPLFGTFVDRTIEKDFQHESYVVSTRSFLRFSVALGSIAFLGYGLHDRLVLPAIYETAWRIRYGVFLPVALVTLAALRASELGRWREPLMLLFGCAATGV